MTQPSDRRPVEGTTGHPAHPTLIVNPKAGGGKALRYDLVARCLALGIEAVLMKRGDRVSTLAIAAVRDGADVIGMAGGDGSQGEAAAVAAAHDVSYVCVPAGTRNHFALDIGLDPSDVPGALAAFTGGEERRIDLARVNGRIFVNNASMGLYGRVVQSKEYRDAKLRTVVEMLPELIGPRSEAFDLELRDPDGAVYSTVQVLLVSNNRYELDPRERQGTRGGMDRGVLGVVVLGAGPPLRRWHEWTVPTLLVDSERTVDVGLDGEAVRLEPPLVFESLPLALRIRTAARSQAERRRLP